MLLEICKYEPKCADLDSNVCGDSNPLWRAGATNFYLGMSSKGTIKSSPFPDHTVKIWPVPSRGNMLCARWPQDQGLYTDPLYFYPAVRSTVRVHCSPDPTAGLRHHSSKTNQSWVKSCLLKSRPLLQSIFARKLLWK